MRINFRQDMSHEYVKVSIKVIYPFKAHYWHHILCVWNNLYECFGTQLLRASTQIVAIAPLQLRYPLVQTSSCATDSCGCIFLWRKAECRNIRVPPWRPSRSTSGTRTTGLEPLLWYHNKSCMTPSSETVSTPADGTPAQTPTLHL